MLGSEQMFLIGVRILAGTMTAMEAGRAYAALAGAVIATLHERIARDMAAVHGTFPGDGTAVVAFGKLGSGEMTATSDLDLMVIYDVPADALSGALLSDGPKPLPASTAFARLTQRLAAALSAPTAEGSLYDVDLRLRPSGQKGPLATSLSSFINYQSREAWTWEHMALTRARVVSGTPEMRVKVEQAISAILCRPRTASVIAADVRDMRARIAAEKGTADPWDLKQVRGGLVDIEFIAQYLQLIHAALTPAVLNPNTITALGRLTGAGLLDPTDGEALVEAARLTGSLMGVLRLMADGPFNPATAPRGLKIRLAQAANEPDFPTLEARLHETQARTRELFDRLI